MGDPSPQPTIPLGPVLVTAPSAQAPNNVAPMPPTLAALVSFGQTLKSATLILKSVLVNLDDATKAFAGALVAAKAIAGIADAMDDTFQFHLVGSLPPDATAASNIKTLRQKAEAFSSAFQSKTGGNPDPRKFVQELDKAVSGSAEVVVNLLRDPSSLKIVKAFCDDPAVDDKTAYINLWGLGQIVALALDLLARTDSADKALEMATEILEQKDERQSVPAIAIPKSRKSWNGFVAATAVATGTVGNLPGGTDSLSIALLKIFAAHRLPTAALRKPEAGSLEADLFSMLVDSLQLSDAQKTALTGLKEDLKGAQADVVRRAKQEAIAAAKNVPGNPPRAARAATRQLEQKTKERLLAEQNCKAKAEKLSTFYEDTYGPENQKIFGSLQRGAFMDGFVTVLTIIQLIAAFKELDDPEISGWQKGADLALSTVLTMGAVVSTVGRHAIDVGITQVDLVTAARVLEAANKGFGIFAGLMAIISGASQVVTGLENNDIEQIVVGAATGVSGALILYGAAAASTVATGVGVAIGVLLAAYGTWTALMDASKNETEKAIDGLIDSLEKKKVFTSKTAVQHLGLDSLLDDVKGAVPAGCSQLLRNPHGEPSREALVAKMQSLGFNAADAMSLVESADDETVRLNPSLAPQAIVPTP